MDDKAKWVKKRGLIFGLVTVSLTLSLPCLGGMGQLAKPVVSLSPFGLHAPNNNKLSNPALQSSSTLSLEKQSLLPGSKKTNTNDSLRSGTESSGGGSTDRQNFYKPLAFALQKLSSQSKYVFNTKSKKMPAVEIIIDDLINALRNVTIDPSHDQLYDLEGVKVDLFNDPNTNKIYFNIESWNTKTEAEKIQLGLHELMGILKIPDPFYSISTRLAEYVFSSNTSSGFGSISVCGISVKHMGYSEPGLSVEQTKKDFASTGGQVKTCIIKDGMRTGGQTYTAVISIYIDYAWALLIPSSGP